MKHKQLQFGKGFRVAIDSKRAQVAEMVIPPGEAEGDRCNRHRSADQWLYVVAGTGRTTVNGQRVALKAGTLLWIEHEEHEIENTGHGLLRTLNFYTPALIPSRAIHYQQRGLGKDRTGRSRSEISVIAKHHHRLIVRPASFESAHGFIRMSRDENLSVTQHAGRFVTRGLQAAGDLYDR
jgi:mannose-6-phosphate isomerase-like protein (cupin superfamily)